jgi:DNA-binding NarL/FixJ family response regulator
LIAEDDALTAEDLRGLVIMLGYDVVGVTDSAEQAVQSALELRPDVVLLDFKMHGPMNGVEAGNLIQQSVASAVVYVTANAEALKQPHIVPKPFTRATLSSAITAALAGRQNRSSF